MLLNTGSNPSDSPSRVKSFPSAIRELLSLYPEARIAVENYENYEHAPDPRLAESWVICAEGVWSEFLIAYTLGVENGTPIAQRWIGTRDGDWDYLDCHPLPITSYSRWMDRFSAYKRDTGWRDYYSYCLETGEDPLHHLPIRETAEPVIWEFVAKQQPGYVELAAAKPKGHDDWIFPHALPDYVQRHWDLSGKVMCGIQEVRQLLQLWPWERGCRRKLTGNTITGTTYIESPYSREDLSLQIRNVARMQLSRLTGFKEMWKEAA